MNGGLLQTLVSSITERARRRETPVANVEAPAVKAEPPRERVRSLCHDLLSSRGEASGVALACELMNSYERLSRDDRERFFDMLRQEFGPDRPRLQELARRYAAEPGESVEQALASASEPRRQELIRRLNLAHGNIAKLVSMRAELLEVGKHRPDLAIVDADFRHLFTSWFNRGFLSMRRIDWSSPAVVLDAVIRYETVHAFAGWDDLRRRLAPADRRCYAFFHPALPEEPLIFVEVALTSHMPDAIAPLLAEQRQVVPIEAQTTAVFYSINNTQRGLQGVSFGNFLIKQVAQDLRRDVPSLTAFVTLSPVPGFAAWLDGERRAPDSDALASVDGELLALLDEPGWHLDPAKAKRLQAALMPVAAHYLVRAKTSDGRPVDPVARFHLGNGARLERLNWLGDLSPAALRRSHGLMVNYLYALADVERHHEAYSNDGVVAASETVLRLLAPSRRGAPPSRSEYLAGDDP